LLMKLVTVAWEPPRWAEKLPQKFSAATTLITPVDVPAPGDARGKGRGHSRPPEPAG
jgi:hypothetical protein